MAIILPSLECNHVFLLTDAIIFFLELALFDLHLLTHQRRESLWGNGVHRVKTHTLRSHKVSYWSYSSFKAAAVRDCLLTDLPITATGCCVEEIITRQHRFPRVWSLLINNHIVYVSVCESAQVDLIGPDDWRANYTNLLLLAFTKFSCFLLLPHKRKQ